MARALSESAVESAAEALFASMTYTALRGAEVATEDDRGAVIADRLRSAIARLNPALSPSSIGEALRSVGRPPYPTLIENNRWHHSLLADGVEVEYQDATTGETRGGRARLIDFNTPSNNDFLVVRQLVVRGIGDKLIRPDLVVFVNGLPLAVIELKDPSDPAADLGMAIDQLGRYKRIAPDLFAPNLLLVASDGLLTRVGSITSGRQRFMPWRPSEGGEPTLEALIHGLFEPAALLDYLRSCVVFEEDERGNIEKKIAGYHQFRAVRKARASVLSALKSPAGPGIGEDAGRGGVVWHTQGSGKSLTMVMLAGALVRDPAMANPTIVIVTDRNDLDDQLLGTFTAGRDLLRQAPAQAESQADLAGKLDRASGGVVFTTIHKFTEERGTISDRANVVVMADEAHRSQYGFTEGGARWMREALPNATFVGFTGTPIDTADKSTPRVFGPILDVYDIRQSVEDGATKPIYYDPHIIPLTVDEAGATEAEAKLRTLSEADDAGSDPDSDVRVRVEALVGAPDRLSRVAAFLVDHWEKRRGAMEGKAMIVTMSRDIAARLYEEVRKLRQAWHAADDAKGSMKVVVSGGPDDPEPLASHVRSKVGRAALARRFKDPADDFRLAIVCDMWLTGFDCPPAHTMYLDKPLAGHNLMQAIARVNRVYGDKPGGLVVDLLGLADRLADALATYTRAGGIGEAVLDVQGEAVPAMLTAFEQLEAFFHGFDYQKALDGDPRGFLSVYVGAIDHVFGQDDGWARFRTMVKKLATAFALAVPHPESEPIAPHLAFFQRVAAMIRKRLADDRGLGQERGGSDIDAAVRQIVGGAVEAGDIIDLFGAVGLSEARLDILSEEFLARVASLEQKNLALEALRKLLNDQIRVTERQNLVLGKKFREALEDALIRYTNKSISTAEMIVQLLELARWVRQAKTHGEELGLSDEEAAFYDALAENGSAREVMESDTLRLMARKLAEMVKSIPKLDWTQRESVRADLRRKVRRLLALYGYPPDLSEDATRLVLKQATLSTENSLNDEE